MQTEKSRSLVCRSLSPLMILCVSSLALEIAFICLVVVVLSCRLVAIFWKNCVTSDGSMLSVWLRRR